jgi:hypothetical protein
MLCSTARSLYTLSEQAIPNGPLTEHDGFTLLIEQQEHRNVLVVANKFLRGLDPTSKLYSSCREWIAKYEPLVRDAFPRLGEIPTEVRTHFGSEVAARPRVLNAHRRTLINMVFDLVGLLTQIHPSGSHNE